MGLDRLSRGTQNIRIPDSVNQKLAWFSRKSSFGERTACPPVCGLRPFAASALTPENLQAFAKTLLSRPSGKFWLFDYVPDVESRPTVSINLFHHTVSDSADSFRGLLGANVILPDEKNHALNKLEGMSQH